VSGTVSIQVRAISDADVPVVAEFLHQHLNRRVPAEAWARSVRVAWKVDAPNHGFLLQDADRVVGANLAFYSERTIDGRPERFCNLGAWCVLPQYRFHGVRLLKALLAQPDLHFTDLSPSGSVVGINARLGLTHLDTTTALVPNLPWPSLPGRGVVSCDPQLVERTLSGPDLDIYRDHADTAAARHLVLIRGGRWCYVVFRRDRRKRLPVFASLLHVSDPELFHAMARQVSRHLLVRHGVLATLAELRVVRAWPPGSVRLPRPRPRMFRSSRLGAEHVDYLYSELVCVAW
jgi:hypothetical protein